MRLSLSGETMNHEAISLEVIGRGVVELYPKALGNRVPKLRCELGAFVRRHHTTA